MAACLAQELKEFRGCRFVDTAWADGDSFAVRFPDGSQQTVRLYGVDCMEIHVQGDDSNARRLRDQRRHFGISDIALAKSVGEEARQKVRKWLEKPFTVRTSFADGRGDGAYKRVYAFVETAEGGDLSELLVREGLARAFGVVRQRADGITGAEWRERLADLELTAARAGRGGWAHTDWERLPEFRREARAETTEMETAKGRAPLGENQRLNPNTAARDQLMQLPGIGEKTALAIIEGRPYRRLEDLLQVPGIGPVTLRKIGPLLEIAPL